jgi:hypothetical protein
MTTARRLALAGQGQQVLRMIAHPERRQIQPHS